MTRITKSVERGGRPLVPLFLGLVLACGTAMAAEPQQLTPQSERIADGKISKDRKTFESMQARIRTLNANGVPVSNYHLAKAQAYLDVALDEYLENDRSSFVEQALGESNTLLRALEAGEKNLSLATYPLDVDKNSKSGTAASKTSENRLRPDLWAQAERIKQHEQFACAAEPTAQFEVELLQAIHEDRLGGWRRTSPYIAIAESLAARAQEALDVCVASAKVAAPVAPTAVVKAPEPVPVPPNPPAPPAAAVAVVEPARPPAPPVVVPVPAETKMEVLIILSERVFFAFGRAEVTAAGQARMREVAETLNAPAARNRKIFVDGYTDDVGDSQLNQSLSERRAEAVRHALTANGIDAARLTVRAFGEFRPVQPNRRPDGTDDPEARAQNRRVELVLEAP